jgi:hypothetical protein
MVMTIAAIITRKYAESLKMSFAGEMFPDFKRSSLPNLELLIIASCSLRRDVLQPVHAKVDVGQLCD